MNPIKMILTVIAGVFTSPFRSHLKKFYTRDATAINYRMGAGAPGHVTRTHPVSIEPALNDPSTPAIRYGQFVTNTTSGNSVRPITTGDLAANLTYLGVTVRPWPTQAGTASAFGAIGFGGGVPEASAPIDVMRIGYILTTLYTGGPVVKGGKVYVRVAASAGASVIGGVEGAADGADNILIPNAQFNGPADADGTVEIVLTNP